MARGGARPGAGKKKGTVHETTRRAKEAIENVFVYLQERDATSFKRWCENNLDDFYKILFPKLIPVQVRHGGDDENKTPIRYERVIINVIGNVISPELCDSDIESWPRQISYEASEKDNAKRDG